MVYSLLLLICLCCGLIGYKLGTIEASAWSLLMFAAGAVISLQVVYIATLLMKA